MKGERRGQLNAAFVLHQRPYRDTSRIVDLLTAEYGRVALVGRGVRSRKGSQAALLQPFRPLLVSWSGRGDMKTLNAVEPSGEAYKLQGAVLFCAYYMNELLLRLTQRHDPHPELFAIYQSTLDSLSNGEEPSRPLRIFEKRLLEYLGYGLNLSTEDGKNIRAESSYFYQVERGPVLTVDDDQGSYRGRSLLALASEELADEDCLIDARRLLRQTLDHYLGDKPLHSRQIMYSMRSW